jgi:GNAT superfamily N-acetyltransferase
MQAQQDFSDLIHDVHWREARCTDAPALREMFYRLSRDSIYNWLCIGAPHAPQFADRLALYALGDGTAQAAVAAVTQDAIIGIACFVRDDAVADIAAVVEDTWQGRTVGKRMLHHLAELATARGIGTFTADVMAQNRRAVRLLNGVFAEIEAEWGYGSGHLTMSLASLRPNLPRLLPPDDGAAVTIIPLR